MKPLLKWPGGKESELGKLEGYLPPFSRYIEPFLGGGAMFFHLCPDNAVLGDLCRPLIELYALIQQRDETLKTLLYCYARSLAALGESLERFSDRLLALWRAIDTTAIEPLVSDALSPLWTDERLNPLVLDRPQLMRFVQDSVLDKYKRTVKNDGVRAFSERDLIENLQTGFFSGLYLYFRKVYNDLFLGRRSSPSTAYACALFCFIREYCYGSMFRYNAQGEFNIPYGGKSYNRKDFSEKIRRMTDGQAADALSHACLFCGDFEALMGSLSLCETDFLFLDPPYDTDFSDYEGKDFTRSDQARLAQFLKTSKAKWMLVIKRTDFIHALYSPWATIRAFDNQYTYNVRSRNDRKVEHLIITNYAVDA